VLAVGLNLSSTRGADSRILFTEVYGRREDGRSLMFDARSKKPKSNSTLACSMVLERKRGEKFSVFKGFQSFYRHRIKEIENAPFAAYTSHL
jgi:hypothetical protein